MISVAFIIIGLVVLAGLALLGIWLLIRVITEFQPDAQKVNKDLDKLRQLAQNQHFANALPWNPEELSLLSLEQVNHKVKKGITTTAYGVFTSIYEEPMLSYAYKEYLAPGKNAILYAATSEHEFVYRITNKGITVTIDGEKVGTLKDNGVLYDRKQRLLARVNRNKNELLSPVLVRDKEIASLINPKLTKAVTPRALELVSDNIDKEDEKVFLALTAFEMAYQRHQKVSSE